MQSKKFRYAWMFSLLVTVTLACSVFSGIGGQINDAKETAQSVATDVGEGQNLITTAKALATEAEGSGVVETARAMVTQAGESGAAKTIEAFATEQGPGLLETAQALVTEQGPGAIETAKAFATTEGPGLIETGQAIATQYASGQAPPDIPMVEGQKDNLVTTENLVSYSATMDFQTVVDFYKTEMPANGWTKVDQGSLETSDTAILNYTRSDRDAAVIINFDSGNNQTIVTISIQAK